jgi:hypothetical protein
MISYRGKYSIKFKHIHTRKQSFMLVIFRKIQQVDICIGVLFKVIPEMRGLHLIGYLRFN